MIRNREEWIDIAKGVAMLLVMWGHTYFYDNTEGLFSWINFFHVPVWIFLAFLFFKKDYWILFIRKKFLRLLKPYYIVGVVTTFVCMESVSGWKHFLIGERACGAMWFLPMLFSTFLLYFILCNLSVVWQVLLSISLSFFTSVFLENKPLPMNFDTSLYMLPFVVFAYTYRREILIHKFSFKYSLLFMIVMLLVHSIGKIYDLSLTPNFYSSSYGFYPLSLILGFGGIYIVCWFAKYIEPQKGSLKQFLEFVGKNSLIFLVFHQRLVMDQIYKLEKVLGVDFPSVGLISNVTIFLLVILICSLLSIFFNKYIKWKIF